VDVMTDPKTERAIIYQLVQELKHEGFESSIEWSDEDDYVTLRIQRLHRYY
jgi:hypothetical protein